MKGYYSISGICRNCNWVGKLWFAHGTIAVTRAERVACPNCKCKTATANLWKR